MKKGSFDYYLILATVVVFFCVSAICIFGMFYFKLAQIQQLAEPLRILYMERMNQVVAPFIISLLLLLSICIPKRLLPLIWLNRFVFFLGVIVVVTTIILDLKTALFEVLGFSLVLQTVVLVMALLGSSRLNFVRKGYWLKIGSSLIHLGVIIFIFDLFFYRYHLLHLVLFWVTTSATVLGMLCCFYSDTIVKLCKKTEG